MSPRGETTGRGRYFAADALAELHMLRGKIDMTPASVHLLADTYQGRFLMAMREFMCCGAMCHVRAPDPQHRYRPLHPHRRLTDVMALFCEGERGFAQSSAVASACTFLSEAEQLTWGSCRELHSGDIPYATYVSLMPRRSDIASPLPSSLISMPQLPDDEDDLRPLGVPSTADLVRIATVAGRYIGEFRARLAENLPAPRAVCDMSSFSALTPPSRRLTRRGRGAAE